MLFCIRPHLEYSTYFWVPHDKKHVDQMEWVQRKPAKMVRALETKCYEAWLKELAMCSLELGRVRRYNSHLKSCHAEEGEDLLSMAPEGRTWTNSLTLQGIKLRLDTKANVSIGRAVQQWDSLLYTVVGCTVVGRPQCSLPGRGWIATCNTCSHFSPLLNANRASTFLANMQLP